MKAFSSVVGALTELPPRLFCLGEVPFRFFRPVWPGRFDLGEIWVWVPLDMLLLVEALFVTGRVLLALLFIAEVGGHGQVVVAGMKQGLNCGRRVSSSGRYLLKDAGRAEEDVLESAGRSVALASSR